MALEIKKANRSQVKNRVLLSGIAGSGKTMSSLFLAQGMVSDWTKICVIDTEKGSSNLYAHVGDFSVLELEPPFSPERYIEAITLAENEGFECIVIDSLSHEWDGGEGSIIDIHSKMQGNSFTNWSKLTPRHNNLINKILQSKAHIIATSRAKQEYVMNEESGKKKIDKVGMQSILRNGTEYEFTIVFNIDSQNLATATKDRTGLFKFGDGFKISPKTGKELMNWCSQGKETINENETDEKIKTICQKYPKNKGKEKLQDILKEAQKTYKELTSTEKLVIATQLESMLSSETA